MLKINIKKITGNWTAGYALDKHLLNSEFIGNDEFGHPRFNNTRTEVGEAVYQLKYRQDWEQVDPLANAIVSNIVPKLSKIRLVIPVPPSTPRARQPMYEVSQSVAKILGVKSFENIVRNKSGMRQEVALKNLGAKANKINALKQRLELNDGIQIDGCWNALVLDDLYDTGASLETVCELLHGYRKINKIYVATLTWS